MLGSLSAFRKCKFPDNNVVPHVFIGQQMSILGGFWDFSHQSPSSEHELVWLSGACLPLSARGLSVNLA